MPSPTPSPKLNPMEDLIERWKLLIPKEPYNEEDLKRWTDPENKLDQTTPSPNPSAPASPQTVRTKIIEESTPTGNPNWKRQLDMSRLALMERQNELLKARREREAQARAELAGLGDSKSGSDQKEAPSFDYSLPNTTRAMEAANREYESLSKRLEVPEKETNHLAEALITFLPALAGTALGAAVGGPGMAGAGLSAGASGGVTALDRMRTEEKERRQARIAAAKEELTRKAALQKEKINAISKAEIAPLESQAIMARAVAPELLKFTLEEKKAKLKDLLERSTESADTEELKMIGDQLKAIDSQTKEAIGKPGEKTVKITEQPLEQIEDIKSRYRKELDEINASRRAELEAAKRAHDAEMKKLQAELDAKRDDKKFDARKDEIKQQFENKKDEIKIQHENKKDEIDQKAENDKKAAEQKAKDNLSAIKAKGAVKGTGKGSAKGAGSVKLDKDVQTKVDVIARESAKKEVIANKLEAAITKLDDPSLSKDLKITQAEQLLKVLNSQDGQDAVGAEEAKRIGSLLEFKILNFTRPGSVFGRDLDKFRDSVALTVNRLRDEVKSNNGLIDQYKAGGRPEGKQIPVLNGQKPKAQGAGAPTASDDAKRLLEIQKRKEELLRKKAGKR